jgi:hypothetical protein
MAWVREAELQASKGVPYLVAVPITDDMSEVRRSFRKFFVSSLYIFVIS